MNLLARSGARGPCWRQRAGERGRPGRGGEDGTNANAHLDAKAIAAPKEARRLTAAAPFLCELPRTLERSDRAEIVVDAVHHEGVLGVAEDVAGHSPGLIHGVNQYIG